MNLYKKLPLSEEEPNFRLLELDLSRDAATADEVVIHARLDTYDLRGGIDYDALSYCWGTGEESVEIIINGESVPISPNLFAALKQMRLDQRNTASQRKLWIDAVCINQSDNVEKSHQVMLMRDIYANASRVIIWIGGPDDLSDLAFDTLKRFAADDKTSDGSATYRDIQDTVRKRRAAVQLFIERPYFIRMWIIQEVVVAKEATIRCGSLHLDFDKLQTAIQRMTGSGFFPFSAVTANLTYIGHWRTSYHEMSGPDSEENLDLRLFLDSRDRLATDPRDKIYSLRGIANKALSTGIKVDYDSSVERVYTDFSKYVLNIRPDLQILSAVVLRHRTNSKFSLPSYVPDWSLPKYGGGFLQRSYRFKPTCLFRAAGATTPRIITDGHSDKISVEGIPLDTVARIIPIKSILGMGEDGSVSITESSIRELAADVIASETYPFTGEPPWIAYFHTMTADRTALSPRINDEYRAQFFAAFGGWSLPNTLVNGQNLPPSVWAEVSKGVGTIIEDKEMFLTTQGYLGLGHEGLQVADVVCIFSGGEVPFLLRETVHDSKKVFRFLSECYVHGVMDGEATDNLTGNPIENFSIE
jgi:Heterokaryon incompatibility protein (HET)